MILPDDSVTGPGSHSDSNCDSTNPVSIVGDLESGENTGSPMELELDELEQELDLDRWLVKLVSVLGLGLKLGLFIWFR